MIQDQIDGLIKSAILNKQAPALRAYRGVKAAFTGYKTVKNAKPLDEIAEINIIHKMISSREDSIQQFKAAGRIELAEAEEDEIKYLKSILPPDVSEEDVYAYAVSIITEKGMQNMGKYIKILKEEFPTADGKMIATIVKSLL
ncbi:MAG: GatB/YqeY domain-containing protein [Clostridiales bacterium]|uniref:GatB/YqeY domain-containing protein n=1 Tax=Terrisporobacter sp. TaxID=1965305 RepID=UPI002A560EE7|nr:GatB/YqeY domain-containing protein [Terrisporobacter sp.]MDD7757377.1 GatB/YqeY domain-containing protein [Clostridiales bacterium]MDY4136524.1 GatB/YqeY domain-containing protein [Terrisporobacter sp.]